MRTLSYVLAVGLALGAAGCGTNDPYSILQQQPGDMLPPLSAPIAANTAFSVRPFGVNGSTGFQYFGNYGSLGQPNVTAPAAGQIESIDANLNPGYYAVTIMHSPMLTSRVSGLQTTSSIQVGAFVNGGDVIGTMPVYSASIVPIELDVYLNGGTAVCPLTFLSSAARTSFTFTLGGATSPCPQ